MKRLLMIFFILMMILFVVVPTLTKAQEPFVVTGTVVDAESGHALEGCHVFLNEHMGTVSDANGEFSLIIPTDLEANQVHFSFVGFNDHALSLAQYLGETEKDFVVQLQPDFIMLDEVVFVSNPMDDFREAMEGLVRRYGSDRQGLARAIEEELRKIDPDLPALINSGAPSGGSRGGQANSLQ